MKRKPMRFLYKAELRFAELLRSLHLAFLYQPTKFCLGDTSYAPDFYVPKLGIYYEVVATRQAISLDRLKIDKVRELYPFVKIKVVNPDGSPYRFRANQFRKQYHIGPQPLKFELQSYYKRILLKDGYLTIGEVAKKLGRTRSSVAFRLLRGRIPGLHRDNGHYFVKRDVFEAWLKEQEIS